MIISTQDRATLQEARQTYGEKNQISVAVEELNELACVLCKFIRYDEKDHALKELRESVIDEVADVSVVLEHIKAIFEIGDESIRSRSKEKVARLRNWLSKSKSMEQTTIDRDVPTILEKQLSFLEKNCANCANKDDHSVCEYCTDFSLYSYRTW